MNAPMTPERAEAIRASASTDPWQRSTRTPERPSVRPGVSPISYAPRPRPFSPRSEDGAGARIAQPGGCRAFRYVAGGLAIPKPSSALKHRCGCQVEEAEGVSDRIGVDAPMLAWLEVELAGSGGQDASLGRVEVVNGKLEVHLHR